MFTVVATVAPPETDDETETQNGTEAAE